MANFNDINRKINVKFGESSGHGFSVKFGESFNISGGGTNDDESSASGLPAVTTQDDGKLLAVQAGEWTALFPANAVEKDNSRPITSAAVYTTVGNINALLETI